MARVLIIGNSVSAVPSREDRTVIAYPERLQSLLGPSWEVKTLIGGGKTLKELTKLATPVIRSWRPDVVTIQMGQNDCAPRPLSAWERAILAQVRPRFIQNRIISYLHDHRPEIIRRRGLKQFLPLPAFARSLCLLLQRASKAGASHAIILPITEIPSQAEERAPGFNREIRRYSRFLKEMSRPGVTYLDQEACMGDLGPDDYSVLPNSVHWGTQGHRLVATRLMVHLQQVFGHPPKGESLDGADLQRAIHQLCNGGTWHA